ncbi:MAG: hypothetical protein HY689_09890 [Chloroflexi bacterium]|nr:hypothetical protein [Chloroflexota bacterium]
METSALPKPPTGLKAAGRKLWQAITADFELRADELTLLEAACRLTDELAAMEKELRGAPVMVPGSRGQQRPNPLLAEARQHRLALGRLLAQLGIDDADAEQRGRARSNAGRTMARLRWG